MSGGGLLNSFIAYVGPGDVQQSGWQAFWGLRAFNLATCGTSCADVRCVTAAKTVTVPSTSTGVFNWAYLQSQAPNDTYFVSKLYDQSGNGNHLVQATNSKQPQLFTQTPSLNNPAYYMAFTYTADQYLANLSLSASIAAPWLMYAIAERTGNTGSYSTMLGASTAHNPNLSFTAGANQINQGGDLAGRSRKM
jgi:hypothetical protein